MKVLITGGSGLVGMSLTRSLLSKDIEVVHLTRHKNSKAGVKTFEWDYKRKYLEQGALNGITHIVHLAGAGIADKPWTMKRKREIVKSRVQTARLLLEKASEQNILLQKFISASGIGFYGAITSEKVFNESDQRGSDFVAECCVQWENQAKKFEDICDVAIIRTGLVLAKNEGALGKLESSVKRGLGSPIGSGNQYMPWIHIDDLTGIYEKALIESPFKGIFNAVASQHVQNKDFMVSLATALNKKIILPKIPAFMMKFIFGEMSEILLEGSRIDNKKLIDSGYQFKYNYLETTLKELYQ
ncbi:MAG: TIGR01777 family protein [Flavobacteriales bacterium]|nr:TIGR01777 family protein [Flavobacteriales bacterium]